MEEESGEGRAEWMLALPPCLAIMLASAIELFSGAAILTLGLRWHNVPVVAPWDLKYGSRWDVLQHGWMLEEALRNGFLALVHMGTPCAFLRGRFSVVIGTTLEDTPGSLVWTRSWPGWAMNSLTRLCGYVWWRYSAARISPLNIFSRHGLG